VSVVVHPGSIAYSSAASSIRITGFLSANAHFTDLLGVGVVQHVVVRWVESNTRNFGVILCKLQIAFAERPFAGVWAIPTDLVRLLNSVVVEQSLCARPTVGDKLADAHVAVLGACALLAELVLATLFVETINARSSAHVGERTVAVDHAIATVIPVFVSVEALFLRVKLHQTKQLTISKNINVINYFQKSRKKSHQRPLT